MNKDLLSFSLICLLSLSTSAWGQARYGTARPVERDLEPPRQDLTTLEGEIVWVQATLLRGDPTPYRDPQIPLATYEQGILDDEGNLWTILDTPNGRELRYNPELRGQRVELEGWLYSDAKIINVKSWGDSQSHPVRVDEDYPEPERIPFDADKAERIESIKPTAPKSIRIDLMDKSLWRIQEGTDLGDTSGPPGVQVPESEGSGRFQEILQDEGLLPSATEEIPEGEESSGDGLPDDPAAGSSSGGSASFQPPPKIPTPGQPTNLQSKILNERGEPLARPEEFDDALQESLFE